MVRVTAPTESADMAIDLLWQYGPRAVSEHDDGHAVVFVAGFDDPATATKAQQAAAALFVAELLAPDRDSWVETWRASEPHHLVGPFCLRLPEHQRHPDQIDLVIEPGTAFGYSHASTRLALALLSALDLSGSRVADVGCGTGVLAIAAALLGASPVNAVDIDEPAVGLAQHNAMTNRVTISAAHGSIEALTGARYDVMLGNMLAPTLCDLASTMHDRTDSCGVIVVSGLLETDEERVCKAFAPRLLKDRRSEGEWLALTLA